MSRSGYRAALKRNDSHIGAEVLSNALETGFRRQTITRWEILLASAIVYLSKSWYAKNYRRVEKAFTYFDSGKAADASRCFDYEIVSVYGDATNSRAAAHGCKAHGMRVTACFVHLPLPEPNANIKTEIKEMDDDHADGSDSDDDDDDDLNTNIRTTNQIWTDLQQMPVVCGGVEMRALFLRQTESCGVKSWLSQDGVGFCESGCFFHIRCFIIGTDQGGDVRGAARFLNDDFAVDVDSDFDDEACTDTLPPNMFIWKIRQWCWQHACHLMAKKQLNRIGKGKYFKDLARRFLIHPYKKTNT